MKIFFSLRRTALAVALALLGLVGAASPAFAAKYESYGPFTITSVQGHKIAGVNSGNAKPGGEFTATFSGKQKDNFDGHGSATMDFGGGLTLTYDYDVEFDDLTGWLVGTYEITGGTGKFKKASGSGLHVIMPAGDGTGQVWQLGTLSH